jgi:hypothetical protein
LPGGTAGHWEHPVLQRVCKVINVGCGMEQTMKRLTLAVGILALGFAAATPARADFAVVQFGDGLCKVWWDSGDNPWGDNWTKIQVGLPDWLSASAVLANARSQGVCR